MSRNNYAGNTQQAKFRTEFYNKEQHARLGWYNQRQIKPQPGSKQLEVFRKKIEAAAPKPSARLLELRGVQPKSYNKRIWKHEDNMLRLAKLSSEEHPDATPMRPVTSFTRDRLYDGFTKEEKGRYEYLNERFKKIPERKYNCCYLSSWDYGWELDQAKKMGVIAKPAFGRTRIVEDTFYTRTGIPGLHRSETFSC